MFVKVVFILMCVSSVWSQTEANTQCIGGKTVPVKVLITSRQNQTGYWISQVGLEQNGILGQPGTSVSVEHNTTFCTRSASTLNLLLTLTAPPPSERSDYEFFAGVGYYKFHNSLKTFEQARQTCANEDAHLAVINSEKESEVLTTLFSRFTEIVGSHKHLAWVGIHRIGEAYFSIFGEHLGNTGFARWYPGEPQKGSEYCVTVTKQNGGLVDISCDYRGAFICEQ